MLSFSRILDDLYRNTVSRRDAAAATMVPHRLDAAVKMTENEFVDTPPLLTGRSSLNEVASNRRRPGDEDLSLQPKPLHQVPPANQLRFPFNQRWILWDWKLLNFRAERFQPDAPRMPRLYHRF
jgi:hypothetical protein